MDDHILLVSLDAGNAEQARSLLILREDGHLLAVDSVSPYMSDELAKSTCRIMRKVARQRADNAGKYAEAAFFDSPETGKMVTESSKMVSAALQGPAACLRAGREK